MIFDVNQNSLQAMVIPDAVRSRIAGVSRFFNYGTRPFGALAGRRAGDSDRPAPDALDRRRRLSARRLLPARFSDAADARGGPGVSRSEILRHRPLRALLFAEVISTTGAQMTWLALPVVRPDDDRLAVADDARDDRRARRVRRSGPVRGELRAAARRAPVDAARGRRAGTADDAGAGAPLERPPDARRRSCCSRSCSASSARRTSRPRR